MNRRLIFFGFMVCATAWMMVSCGSGTRVLRVLTTRPELVFLTQDYQSAHPGIRIDVSVVDDTSALFRSGTINYDLVIAENLVNPVIASHLYPLDRIFENGQINRNQYLDAAFSLGMHAGKLRSVLLGFDLPVILGPKKIGSVEFQDHVLVDLATLRDASLQYIKKNNAGRIRNLGFSPLRDLSFMELVCWYYQAAFAADSNGNPKYDDAGMSAAIAVLRDWVRKNTGSVTTEQEFLAKYDYLPESKLIESRRLVYIYGGASATISEKSGFLGELGVQWPVRDGYIQVLPRLLGAGIPEKSLQTELATELLVYVMQREVQERALQRTMQFDISSFGFLGYFSTNRHIYEKSIPLAWPLLRQSIPPENLLRFPVSIPLEWPSYSNDVLYPFILSQLDAGAVELPILFRQTQQWLLKKGEQP